MYQTQFEKFRISQNFMETQSMSVKPTVDLQRSQMFHQTDSINVSRIGFNTNRTSFGSVGDTN